MEWYRKDEPISKLWKTSSQYWNIEWNKISKCQNNVPHNANSKGIFYEDRIRSFIIENQPMIFTAGTAS